MLDRLKVAIKFHIQKIKWRKNNKDNFTSLRHFCDITKIHVGKGTYGGINAESFGNEKAFLEIGNYCSISQNVRFILDGEHNYKTISTYPFDVRLFGAKCETMCKGPILIGDDVWIGERSIILSGVKIGQGAIVGAGSVVRKDIPPYAIYVGDRIVKYRFNERIIEALLEIDYSKLTGTSIKKLRDLFYTPITEENVQAIVKEINSNI